MGASGKNVLRTLGGMLGFRGPNEFYKSYAGKNSAFNVVFDPGNILGMTDSTPRPKVEAEVDEEASVARERERKRLSTGSRSTILSGRRSDALGASIGKRTLGGAI